MGITRAVKMGRVSRSLKVSGVDARKMLPKPPRRLRKIGKIDKQLTALQEMKQLLARFGEEEVRMTSAELERLGDLLRQRQSVRRDLDLLNMVERVELVELMRRLEQGSSVLAPRELRRVKMLVERHGFTGEDFTQLLGEVDHLLETREP